MPRERWTQGYGARQEARETVTVAQVELPGGAIPAGKRLSEVRHFEESCAALPGTT